MKSISFDQLPVGTDFYCFGEKWNKVSDEAARLVRAKRRPRKPRRFAADEQVLPVGGVKEFLLRQIPLDPIDDDERLDRDSESVGSSWGWGKP
jgi:hypothetical protein